MAKASTRLTIAAAVAAIVAAVSVLVLVFAASMADRLDGNWSGRTTNAAAAA
jgi:hypothetical protein